MPPYRSHASCMPARSTRQDKKKDIVDMNDMIKEKAHGYSCDRLLHMFSDIVHGIYEWLFRFTSSAQCRQWALRSSGGRVPRRDDR